MAGRHLVVFCHYMQYVPIWKQAPFIRVLLPFLTGIVIGWYLQPSARLETISLIGALSISVKSLFGQSFTTYRLRLIYGIAFMIVWIALGALVTWEKDIRNNTEWVGRKYQQGDTIQVVLAEPLVERMNSQKAQASVIALRKADRAIPCAGNVIVYFNKDSLPVLDCGSQLIFSKPLLTIANNANPGGFDYQRYTLFEGITHEVFLKKDNFATLPGRRQNLIGSVLFPVREKILSVLRHYIRNKKTCGLAEALLIGYKDDLDKNLVQSYTNTGVVHIVAISGMHIALIYWLLDLVCSPLKKIKHSKWPVAAVVIAGLWLFSLVAGAQASVIRSAVMFTCIVIGKTFVKKASIYNTLAFSAFALLCYNPYWLWDVGFQLSYAAVLSIVIFAKPIYNLMYIKNKMLDFVWKANSVSIAAQLLTTPISLYHFHQFPNYFLLSNFVAVPLSSIIVLGEIALCAVSLVPLVASITGKILSTLMWLMNAYIERIEALPLSLTDNIQISVLQAVLLTAMVCGIGYLMLEKQKFGAWLGLMSLAAFAIIRSLTVIGCDQQRDLIVYNIPKHHAIDLFEGRKYCFIGDAALGSDQTLQNFYLRPTRSSYRANSCSQFSDGLTGRNCLFFNSKRILLIDQDFFPVHLEKRDVIDIAVVSGNQAVNFADLVAAFDIRQFVLDGSLTLSKANYWKKNCALHDIPCHYTNEKGAFVMKLN